MRKSGERRAACCVNFTGIWMMMIDCGDLPRKAAILLVDKDLYPCLSRVVKLRKHPEGDGSGHGSMSSPPLLRLFSFLQINTP